MVKALLLWPRHSLTTMGGRCSGACSWRACGVGSKAGSRIDPSRATKRWQLDHASHRIGGRGYWGHRRSRDVVSPFMLSPVTLSVVPSSMLPSCDANDCVDRRGTVRSWAGRGALRSKIATGVGLHAVWCDIRSWCQLPCCLQWQSFSRSRARARQAACRQRAEQYCA